MLGQNDQEGRNLLNSHNDRLQCAKFHYVSPRRKSSFLRKVPFFKKSLTEGGVGTQRAGGIYVPSTLYVKRCPVLCRLFVWMGYIVYLRVFCPSHLYLFLYYKIKMVSLLNFELISLNIFKEIQIFSWYWQFQCFIFWLVFYISVRFLKINININSHKKNLASNKKYNYWQEPVFLSYEI